MSKRTVKAKKKEQKTVPIKPSAGHAGFNSMVNWLIVLALVLPIIFSRETMDAGIAVRFIFLNIFTALFLAYFFWMNRAYVIASYPLLIRLFFYAGILFIIWNIVSMSFAYNKASGFYETGRQLVNLLLFFILMIAVQNEESKLLTFCKAVSLVAVLNGLAGMMQFYGTGFTSIPGFYPPYGFNINRNLFGSGEVLMLPFITYVLYRGTVGWKIFSSATIILSIVAIILSQTRSAWIAMTVFLVISFILVLIFSPVNRRKWILGTLAAFGFTAMSFFFISNKEEIGESLKERVSSIAAPGSDTTIAFRNISERLKMWKQCLNMIADHPVTGVGPDNWRVVITSYQASHMVWSDGSYVPDRPHNVYLQVASETGIPGAIFYFSMWMFVAIMGFKILLKPQPENRRILIILMLSGLAAFASDSMFSFPAERLEHFTFFIFMGGIILGIFLKTSLETKNERKLPVTWIMGLLALLIFNIVIGSKKFNFEKHMRGAFQEEQQKNYTRVLEEVEAGRSSLITISSYGSPLELYSSIAYKEMKNHSKALEEINKAKKYNPFNPRVYNNLGAIYSDMKQYQQAIPAFQQALQYAPTFEISVRNLAEVQYHLGKYQDCIETLNRINLENNPYLRNLKEMARQRIEESKN